MKSGTGFDLADNAFEGETLKMPSSAQKEPVKTIAETPAIGNADEQAALRSHDPPNLPDGAGNIVEVLQAVMGNHQIETAAGKW